MADAPSRTARIVFEAGPVVSDRVSSRLAQYYGRWSGTVLLRLDYAHVAGAAAKQTRESVLRAKTELEGAGVRVTVGPRLGGDRESPTVFERVARCHDPREPFAVHDRRSWERTLHIDADGNVRGAPGGDVYGNLAELPLEAILDGPNRQRALEASERRVAKTCGSCRYFGGCDGDAVAEDRSAAAEGGVEADGCPVLRPMLADVERLAVANGSVRDRRIGEATNFGVGSPGQGSWLRPGARIFGPADVAERITLSAGTEVATSTTVRFHVGALAPRGPFRSPSTDELCVLGLPAPARDASNSFRRDKDVAILALPARVVDPLRAICEECGLCDAPGDDTRPLSVHPGWREAQRALEAALFEYRDGGRALETFVTYRSEPDLAAVTKVDRGQGSRETYVGLHLDSWEGVALRQRATVRNRLSVNLGRASRYLLFVNLPLADMMRAIGLEDTEDVRAVTLFSGHKFMRHFPDYPVIRLELRPGEAYICPTGNVIHDGASPPGPHSDLALHVLGFFSLPVRDA